ncbi:hypothetical protein COT75_00950 [Candidatus Beckwithbacteria bacterium CG10_big_fil_rev_8_21_14_0_10_34_10]|uniref:Rod shape-determining protein MreD n=1 Tax=Candidatus Beckwithbacteria bacterium CG10_big_fil_rev_8_21_14_0_10_34_10 TaxID=1974495 RepID=A0A2H0WA69_9BACT|nr:MAG: hypothetical protein COT75_00950 [Candidatus Beckwithbacteria bacterium CG10_big_fil_rev_8_21_14_0_10_34_10]
MNFYLLFLIFLSFSGLPLNLLLILSFVLGLLNDLFKAGYLGLSSLFFILFSFFLYVFKGRFSEFNFLSILMIIVLSDLIYTFFFQVSYSFEKEIPVYILSWLIILGLNKIKGKTRELDLDL